MRYDIYIYVIRRLKVKHKVISLLTYNFSKEQCRFPEDDLRIETCRSVLSVLVQIF